MSKRAEEAALRAYPPLSVASVCLDGTVPVDLNTGARKRFVEGYEAAEKDLALTWEDIITINQILWDLHYEGWPCESEIQDEARFREALKRFKEARQ